MHKKINSIIVLIIMCGLSVSLVAAPKTLARESFRLNNEQGNVTAEKFIDNNEVGVTIKSDSGQSLLEIKNIGSQDKKFLADEKTCTLLVKDLTGDTVPEVIATAYYGPASALYVFRYQPEKKAFVPMKFIDSKDVSLQREYMVSDLPLENGQDMRIEADNTLLAVAKIFPAKSGQKAVVGEYKFAYADGSFKLVSKKPVADKE